MSARAAVLAWLTKRVGFPFSEAELAPTLRRRVGELSDVKQRIDEVSFLIGQKEVAVTTLRSRRKSETIWMIMSAVIGALLLIIIIGVALFVVTYLMYRRSQKTGRLIEERTVEIANLKAEHLALTSSLDAKLTALTPEIFNELSSAHQVRATSTSSGSTVQVVKETIKEVVMIPCAYCHSLMPQTSPRCPHCGATRRS